MNNEITKKKLKSYVNLFCRRYRMTTDDAWDCTTILLQKAKWKVYNFSDRMIHYAYVDYLRDRYGRKSRTDDNTDRIDFKMSLENHADLEFQGSMEYAPGIDLTKTFVGLVQIIREHGSRKIIGIDERFGLYKGKVKPISVRRIMFKYAIGWTMPQIATHCGMSEGRISQILKAESNRLYNLKIWK